MAYAIGYDKPVQATVVMDYFDGEDTSMKEMKISLDEYDLSPSGIIKTLELQEPKFEKTAEWGHMGTGQKWG